WSFTFSHSVIPHFFAMTLDLDPAFSVFQWSADPIWTVYPADSPFRRRGIAVFGDAEPTAHGLWPPVAPQHPWARDEVAPFGVSNEFLHTKPNVAALSFTNQQGTGLLITPLTPMSAKCWSVPTRTHADGTFSRRLRVALAPIDTFGEHPSYTAFRSDPGPKVWKRISPFMGPHIRQRFTRTYQPNEKIHARYRLQFIRNGQPVKIRRVP
ncbi:MAG: hypothetical protein D6820_01420, partial [Lentisphaerae bacterium]